MKRYKMVCCDLDDTLLNKACVVSERLKTAVKTYVDAGGLFRVVTGRMTVGALPVCRELSLRGELCSYQGAIISDIETGKVYRQTTIPWQNAAEIGAFAEENGWYYQTYLGDAFYTATPTAFSEMYAQLSRCTYRKTPDALSSYIAEHAVCPPKLLLNVPEDRTPEVCERLRERFGKEFLINVSKPFIVEIVPFGVNKGLAVRFLAEKYGIDREDVACVGDSENDLTMLSYAGLGVAVGNASPVAKQNADCVLRETCEEDAVAAFLERMA